MRRAEWRSSTALAVETKGGGRDSSAGDTSPHWRDTALEGNRQTLHFASASRGESREEEMAHRWTSTAVQASRRSSDCSVAV